MNIIKIMAAHLAVVLFAVTLSHPAQARHHHYKSYAARNGQECVYDNSGHTVCGGSGNQFAYGNALQSVDKPDHSKRRQRVRTPTMDANGNGVRFIPNPPGTWRVNLSCAHRLAAFWGLGHGLDAVSTWPHKFPHASGPCVGCAAYRSGHIMGIIGGGPGGWVVADFNSGNHLNREYTLSRFPSYYHFLAVRSNGA